MITKEYKLLKKIRDKMKLGKDRTLLTCIMNDYITQQPTSQEVEEEITFLIKWASRGIWSELKKRARIARRITNPQTVEVYKYILDGLEKDYKRVLKYKSALARRGTK
jgi:hypothetical protein